MSSGGSLTPARMSYAAALVGSVTYGIYVVLAGICIHFLIQRRRGPWKQQITLGYTIAMLIVNTIYFISAAKWSEVEFVESTVDPSVFASLLSSPLAICKDTAFTVGTWLADSLILYRMYVIWGHKISIMIFPVILYLASVATGIALLFETARPGGSFGQSAVTDFGIPCWTLSVALNVLTTLLIGGRLWSHQRQMQGIGHKSEDYVSVAAIFAESAAMYSLCGLLYIPLFAKNLPLAYPITALWASVTVIAPNLIILRIALGIDVIGKRKAQLSSTAIPSFSKQGSGQTSTGRVTDRTFQNSATNASGIWTDAKMEANRDTEVFAMKPMTAVDV